MKIFKYILILKYTLLAALIVSLLGLVFWVMQKAAAQNKGIEFARPFEMPVRLEVPAVLDLDKFNSPDFEIISVRRDEKDILVTNLSVLPFVLGKAEFPALTFIDENGQEIKTAPLKIEIKPTKTKIKTKGLVDIRPPYAPFNWLKTSAFVLLAALIIYLAYRLRKKLRAAPSAPVNNPYTQGLPADIVALGQIDDLLLSGLWQENLFKEFYIKLTDIFRDYLTARFNIEAHKYTSRDLARALRRLPDFNGDIPLVERFQKSADLVKFAKVIPARDRRDQDIVNLKLIIKDTTPQKVVE